MIKLKTSAHRELSMRSDQAPFTDARVRQAVAYTLDRPGMISALFKGNADLANDCPFAPVFPSTDTSVAAAHAGHRQGQVAAVRRRAPVRFSTQLITEDVHEIPQYAQIVAQGGGLSASTST